jgi:hypothetical protein
VPGERVPPRVIHISENQGARAQTEVADIPARPLKRTYAMLGKQCCHLDNPIFTHILRTDINEGLVIKRHAPAPSGHKTASTLLVQLDSRLLPGVTEREFRSLFARCDCGMITTQRAFREHKCLSDIIDLTGDD